MDMKPNDCHAFSPGDRVKLLTKTGGCYDGKTGTVIEKLDGALRPHPDAPVPAFYKIELDGPVDIGCGRLSKIDVHPCEQVFPASTSRKSFWHP